MDTALYAGFALAYLALLVWGAALARRHGWARWSNVVLLVVAALVYDNAVLAAGRYIGEGPVLEALNLGRFWLHALLTPLLVVFAWATLVRAGTGWARSWWARGAVVVLTVAAVVLELLTVVVPLCLQPQREYGVLSYDSCEPATGPPAMVLLVSAALLVAAIVVWRAERWPWFLAGVVAMVVGSAVPLPVPSGAVTNAFELALLTALLATKAHQDRTGERRPAPAR